MTKFKLIFGSIFLAMFLHGCSQVLETVLLSDATADLKGLGAQEEFEINIQSLTFETARQANDNPYPRQLMLTGNGAEANVFDESNFLDSGIPPSSPNVNYLLGIGDELSFLQLNELVVPSLVQMPTQTIDTEYLLGVGDQLTLIQLSDGNSISGTKVPNRSNAATTVVLPPTPKKDIVKTSGVIGTDGNILLLGLGSLKAKNRSLNDLQTEVRNILIRNGLEPSFQLEITGFNSKKAFVTFLNNQNTISNKKAFGQNTISITSLPISLKEVILNYGLQSSARDTLILTLVRDGQKFSVTEKQIFDKSSIPVIIQDRDQIEIAESKLTATKYNAVVGSNGNILLPTIGSIVAENRPMADVQADITRILMKQGKIPNFQLEITKFNSKKFFLFLENGDRQAVALNNKKLSLKEAVFSNTSIANDDLLDENVLSVVNLVRNGLSYKIAIQEMLNGIGSKVLIEDGDIIEIKKIKYKLGQVFALSGAGKAKMMPINPSKRETLADILFTSDGALNNLLAKRSEIYLLRGQNPSVAYHLDAQNVSRILVAAKTELRPNDIIYVAERPIVSFSRTLAEIFPLRILLRDIKNDQIP